MTAKLTPEFMLSRVLHRDGLMLVVNKPAGIAVHRGPKGGGAFEDHFDALRYGLPKPPALAHRLDKDTSGALILGRHRKALAHLGLLFKHGKIGKTYWAIVEGGPEADEGNIDIGLSKLNVERGWWMKPDPNGMPSQSTWKVMGRGASAEGKPITWLALEPITGRTHQLRVHCAAIGFPIFGDNIYGTAPQFGGPVMHLMSREVVVPISKNKPPITVRAPVPEHMRERMSLCGWKEGDHPSTVISNQTRPPRPEAESA